MTYAIAQGEGAGVKVSTPPSVVAYFNTPRSSLSPYWLWIPAVILAGAAYAPAVRSLRRHAERRALLVVGAFVLGAMLAALYIVRVGGDYLHARLLLPSIFALCAPIAVVPPGTPATRPSMIFGPRTPTTSTRQGRG